ncbi:MAG: hypothetical protein M1376_20810 [Planctomycetes bacterium]|nr:hypothetical protein [Planctomycetota bacterium]
MIDNVHNSQITQAMGRNAVPHTDTTNKTAADKLDATLQADFADLINQAIQASQTETDAVQRARALLQSGQLTSWENIRSAAENIITFGI